ncbi:MAG TPA: ABC transporter ATP-binding protein [Acidimicrobiales bacterium]|nr:ABC transporter ATP-binding protein [Acidimicrobiales bacterium]
MPPEQPRPLLDVRDLTVSYGGLRALVGVSLSVPEGCVVALLGANGAGKTTTLRAITGLARPSAGAIEFDGVRIDGRRASQIARMGVLHVPEGRGIFPSLTVRANLEMSRQLVGGGDDLVDQGIERFPALGRRVEQLAGTLSGGEQQMLALARVLIARPRLVLLDEISMGLAPMIVAQLFDEVKAMAAAGVTILLVEQYVNAALELADYVYVLDKGRMVDVGEPADLQEDGVLASYLGS